MIAWPRRSVHEQLGCSSTPLSSACVIVRPLHLSSPGLCEFQWMESYREENVGCPDCSTTSDHDRCASVETELLVPLILTSPSCGILLCEFS
jgi:hypothetical protein